MTNISKNIKNYSKYLWIFISINFILYLCFIFDGNFNFDFMNDAYEKIVVKNSIIVASSTLITFILNGLLTSNFKATLVFWKKKNIYPGCRIFTKLIYKDARIDRDMLIQIYGKLPINPEAQNKLWYKIYKNYEYDLMIFNSHRNFLLSRDLTGLSFLFLTIYSIAGITLKLILSTRFDRLLIHMLFLLLQYLILSIVSRNYGNRFACNVLAKACGNSISSNNI